ncbi:MAG: hypothetical protein ACKV2O_05130 [Acidimicrobiales bacterium]
MRRGSANIEGGTVQFLEELIARIRRAGATDELAVRSTMAVKCATKAVAAAIAATPETAWTEFNYTAHGQAEVADCECTTGTGKGVVTRKLVIRRTRFADAAQQQS